MQYRFTIDFAVMHQFEKLFNNFFQYPGRLKIIKWDRWGHHHSMHSFDITSN